MIIDPRNDPKSWEKYFKDVLRKHYGPANLKDIPDSYGGDFGIECYSFSGHAFQCYLPAQFSDKKKLSDAQKDKIARDIKKFTIDNVKEFTKLFKGLKINRWILATPEYSDSDVALYCSTKTLSVRAIGLPYIANDFQILLHTEDDYRSEVKSLRQDTYQLALDFNSIDETQAGSWINSNLEFLEKMDLKLPKVVSSEKIGSTKAFLVQKYLEYENLLDNLRTEWPEIYLKINELISNRRSYLESRFLSSGDKQPNNIITSEIEKLSKDIESEVPTLKKIDLELITWGVIADWLIRC